MAFKELIPSESQEQMALIQWANLYRIPAMNYETVRDYLFASANGGSRHPAEAKNLQKMGVTAGVSDLQLALPYGGYHGMFMEMKCKRPGATVTDKQQAFLERMKKVGYYTCVPYSCDEAIDHVLRYLEMK